MLKKKHLAIDYQITDIPSVVGASLSGDKKNINVTLVMGDGKEYVLTLEHLRNLQATIGLIIHDCEVYLSGEHVQYDDLNQALIENNVVVGLHGQATPGVQVQEERYASFPSFIEGMDLRQLADVDWERTQSIHHVARPPLWRSDQCLTRACLTDCGGCYGLTMNAVNGLCGFNMFDGNRGGKIQAIKNLRVDTSYGLRQAKLLVENWVNCVRELYPISAQRVSLPPYARIPDDEDIHSILGAVREYISRMQG